MFVPVFVVINSLRYFQRKIFLLLFFSFFEESNIIFTNENGNGEERSLDQKYWPAIRQMLANIYQFRPTVSRNRGGGEGKVRRFPRTVCHRGPPRFFCPICTSNLADSGANLSNQVSHRWLPHCDNLRRPRVPVLKQKRKEKESSIIFFHTQCLKDYSQG